MNKKTWQMIHDVAENSNEESATFDQLAEEVMELHLALRGKHADTPAMEWLEIATLASNAFAFCSAEDRETAYTAWQARHGRLRRCAR